MPNIAEITGWPRGVRAAITLRGEAIALTEGGGVSAPPYDRFNLGDHVGDQPEAVTANRATLQRALKAQPVWLSQVHGTQVVALDSSVDDRPTADASWTTLPQRACAILVADCLPVLIARADGGLVGAAHAGWRGLAAGVIPALLNAMLEKDPQAARAGFTVWCGPCIGPQAFEVGPEVGAACARAPFLSAEQVAPYLSAGVGDRLLADLAGLAQAQSQAWAAAMGRLPLTLLRDGRCTVADADTFFSYRRDGVTGRMAALIWRDPDQSSREFI